MINKNETEDLTIFENFKTSELMEYIIFLQSQLEKNDKQYLNIRAYFTIKEFLKK